MRNIFLYFSFVTLVFAEISITAPIFNISDRALPDFTNPLDHGIRDQVTNINNDADGDTNADVNNNTTNTGGTGIGTVQTINNSAIDSDNDVPTLISIRETLVDLERQHRGTKHILSIDENGTLVKTEQSDTLVTLSDIHQELQQIRLNETNAGNQFDPTETEQEAQNIETQFDNAFLDINDNRNEINIEDKSNDHAAHNLDIPTALASFSPSSTLNIFNPTENLTQFNIPSLKDIAEVVSLIIGLFCVIVYFIRTNELLNETFNQVITAPESNAVTNYSVLGNSVGALSVKAIKVGLVVTFITGLALTLFSVLNESISFNGFSGESTSVISDIKQAIETSATGNNTFMSIALYWFGQFIPYASIFIMVGLYWTQVYATKTFVLIGNRVIRIVS